MGNLFEKLSILVARFMVVGFFTLMYVTPLYLLFYLIIFQNFELLNEITIKSYAISYLVGFVIIYRYVMESVKKDEK